MARRCSGTGQWTRWADFANASDLPASVQQGELDVAARNFPSDYNALLSRGQRLPQETGAQRRALFSYAGRRNCRAWLYGRGDSSLRRRAPHVLKTAREAAAANKVLVAGTGVESATETLQLTEYAAELGYDIAMVRTPHYYKKQMQPANVLAFYRFVADRSPLPVIVYNFPQATGYDIPAELVMELAEHPNLIGIKESSGDVEKVHRMVEGTRH